MGCQTRNSQFMIGATKVDEQDLLPKVPYLKVPYLKVPYLTGYLLASVGGN